MYKVLAMLGAEMELALGFYIGLDSIYHIFVC
jgi:hypothetical protein